MSKSVMYLGAAVGPWLMMYLSYSVLAAEAWWLFAFFAFVIMVAALFMVWLFADWVPQPEATEEGERLRAPAFQQRHSQRPSGF
ncbi:MAG: hypothetical protein HYU86_05845 [Chloroflexi bacterium]|nr:hypothetical protein [Chloroflexota bacterium]